MINIVICDDDKDIVMLMRDSINTLCNDFDEEIQIHCFYDAENVEVFLVNNKIDYIFLDIELQGRNGFDLAEKILNKYAGARIIFVSNYEERVFDSLQFNPPKFIRKRKFDSDMKETLELLKRWIDESLQIIHVKADNEDIILKADRIVYIDTYQNYIVYHLINSHQMKQRKTLKHFMEQNRCKSLLKINAGCVVNMKYIQEIKNRRIFLSSGETFGIGRNIEKEIKKKYVIYRLESEEIL